MCVGGGVRCVVVRTATTTFFRLTAVRVPSSDDIERVFKGDRFNRKIFFGMSDVLTA